MNVLVVTSPFGGHDIGHRITAEEEIQEILSGEQAHHVIPSHHDDLETEEA